MSEKKKSREIAATGQKKNEVVSLAGAKAEGIAVPIEMRVSDELHSHYSNHAVIQFGENECIISFFEVKPPIIYGTPEEMEAEARGLRSIKAECVSRIVMARSFVPTFLTTFQELYHKQPGAADQSK